MTSITDLAGIPSPASVAGDTNAMLTPNRSRVTFRDILDEISKKGGEGGTLLGDIKVLQSKVLSGTSIHTPELLLYQIKMSQFGLRVELLSKVAESASSTIRKAQNGQ